MIKKLTIKEVTGDQLDLAEKAAVLAGVAAGICTADCTDGCLLPFELYADNFIPIRNNPI